jgi:hypothetical protein
MASERTAPAHDIRRFCRGFNTQENALACSNQTWRKSGLSSLKVDRVNPLHYVQCVCEFSVKSCGRDDCRRHIESEKHSRHFSSGSGKHSTAAVQKLTSFFPSEKPSEKILCP